MKTAARVELDLDITKRQLFFAAKWVDHKFREGGRITNRDYQEFLTELNNIKGKPDVEKMHNQKLQK